MNQENTPTEATEERLIRIERRQEDLIAAVGGLTDVVGSTNEMLRTTIEWLQEPPKSDLADTLRALAAQISELSGIVVALGGRIGEVPRDVIRLLQAGDDA